MGSWPKGDAVPAQSMATARPCGASWSRCTYTIYTLCSVLRVILHSTFFILSHIPLYQSVASSLRSLRTAVADFVQFQSYSLFCRPLKMQNDSRYTREYPSASAREEARARGRREYITCPVNGKARQIYTSTRRSCMMAHSIVLLPALIWFNSSLRNSACLQLSPKCV